MTVLSVADLTRSYVFRSFAERIKRIFRFFKGRPTFFSVCLIILIYESTYFISVNNILVPEINSKLSYLDYDTTQSLNVIDYLKNISLWGFLIIPVIILAKLAILTFLIQLAVLFKTKIINYKSIFRIVTWGGIILAVGEGIRIIRVLFKFPQLSIAKEFQFFPFGLADIVDTNLYNPVFLVVINYFNIFEFFWFVFVFWELVKLEKINRTETFFIVSLVWIFIVIVNGTLAYFFYEIGTVL